MSQNPGMSSKEWKCIRVYVRLNQIMELRQKQKTIDPVSMVSTNEYNIMKKYTPYLKRKIKKRSIIFFCCVSYLWFPLV